MAKTLKRTSRMYQVKDEYRGKIKLQTGEGTTLLDENTSQDDLKRLYNAGGQVYIELVTPVVAPAK